MVNIQSRQLWTYFNLSSGAELYDGLPDPDPDQQHQQYDDGTSTTSKLCVTVLFPQYLNREVGCACFYER